MNWRQPCHKYVIHVYIYMYILDVGNLLVFFWGIVVHCPVHMDPSTCTVICLFLHISYLLAGSWLGT